MSLDNSPNISATAYDVKEKLARLEDALKADTPNMPTLLRDIHRVLKQDPDVVTILEEEECAILVRALKKQTNMSIATTAIKKSKSGSKPLKKLTIDDL